MKGSIYLIIVLLFMGMSFSSGLRRARKTIYQIEDSKDLNNDPYNIRVKQFKKFYIRIGSNPTTGYSWEMMEKSNSKVKLVGEKFERTRHLDREPRIGEGGHQIFKFKAGSRTGSTTIKFSYLRPWETDHSKDDTMVINVKVLKHRLPK